MNAEDFINNFGHLVDAPEGPMRIRELILQLAFSGDLTTRSAGDQHASVVFDLNQQTKANWIADGKIRQQPLLNRLSDVEHPWDLPETWLWCRLGEVTTYGATDKAEFSDTTQETWVLELEDIEKDTSRLLAKVRAKERRFQSSKNRFSNGDVLYGKLRPYLNKVVLADEDGVCTTEIIPITIYSGIAPQYLRWFLKSPFFKAYATSSTHGMNLPRMGTDAGRNAVFPLAPFAEQKRIVAKVDELMTLCDQLEAQQQERIRRFPVLSRTCHARFAEAPTPANLNRIFDETGTVSPADLRRTILALAVRGQLSRPNPSDGSVESTLPGLASRALQSKDHLYPPHWVQVKLGEVGAWKGGGTPSKSVSEYWTGTMPWVSPKDMKKLRISDAEDHISEAAIEGSSVQLIPENSLLMVVRGMILGRAFPVALTTREVTINQDMKALLPHVPDIAEFLLFVLRAFEPVVLASIERSSHGTCKLLTEVLHSFPIPIPPLAEQRRIVAKVDELMALVDQLEAQQQEQDKLAEAFAKACVASFTGTTQLERPEKMKAPKTELVSLVTLGKKPKPDAKAPLAQLLIQHKGTLPAKSLWQQSGLTIDAFYQQLKIELAQGWIAPPAEAEVKVLEEA